MIYDSLNVMKMVVLLYCTYNGCCPLSEVYLNCARFRELVFGNCGSLHRTWNRL